MTVNTAGDRPRQYSLARLLLAVALVGIWSATVVSPVMMELALLATSLVLATVWIRGRRWLRLTVLVALPLVIAATQAPAVMSDAGLATAESKREAIWSSLVVGWILALVLCGWLSAAGRWRLIPLWAAVLCGAVAMQIYSLKYYHLNQIDFSWPVGPSHLRVESLRGVGRIYWHWPWRRADPRLNQFRSNETLVFGQGGRVRGLRAFLTYIRSSRDGGDHFFGRSLTLQAPYWMLAVAAGALCIPRPRPRPN